MDFRKKAKELVSQMTLEEKASLCSGKNFWYLKGIERFGLPEIMVTDGPHGLRKQSVSADDIGLNQSVPAVCFPTAAATACSFDRDLLREVGKAMGEECRQEEVGVILGPGVNIKRSPLCGRNFEYFSEDPLLTGEMATALIDGIQSQNVGVSIKHFAANNQEKRRMVSESVLDERTFREIYLKAFEIAVKKSKPWTVMCSYNKLFGEFASQSKFLLTDILRNEWGYENLVMTDWGAIVNRVKALEAGLDLEMPHVGSYSDDRVKQAVKEKSIDPGYLDAAAIHVTELILRVSENKTLRYDADAHHILARKAAAQSAVLLKNEGGLLPGKPGVTTAVIGALAKNSRHQGTGSSKINPIKLDNAFDELLALGVKADYAEGYPMDKDDIDPTLLDQACQIARGKEIVYLFAGLPDRYEAEGFDRTDMAMPENHVRLIEAVSKVNKNVVVVLVGGASMEVPWIEHVPAVLMMYLGGEAGGGACADLLLGIENPSGKLAETWALSVKDNPSFDNFPGYPLSVEYREGPFVGYRYYDKSRKAVRFPFGYGLSYTSFSYSDLKISAKTLKNGETLTISCMVKNTGKVIGKEIVQLYTAHRNSVIIRPEQELKGFEKVELAPGETKEVKFNLSSVDLTYYNLKAADWKVEGGEYEIRISASSRDVRLSDTINVSGDSQQELPDFRTTLPCYYDLSSGIQVSDKEFETLIGRSIPLRERQKGTPHTINSTFYDIQDNFIGRSVYNNMRKQIRKLYGDNPDLVIMFENMVIDMPLRFLGLMSGGGEKGFTPIKVLGLVEILNGHLLKGIKLMRQKNN